MLFERPSLGPATFSRGEPGALGDVFDAAFEAGLTSGNINARERQKEEAYDRRIDAIEAALGQRLENPYRMGSVSPGAFGEPVDDPFESFQASLRTLEEQYPDKAGVIGAARSPLEDAREAARAAEGRLGEVMGRTPGMAKYGALLAGGLNAGVYDPINLATMAIGPTGTVGAGARQVLWMGVKQGAANAGVELAAQPVIASWRREAGLDYGASDLALNVGSAFLLGFGLDAGVRGASRGLGLTRGNNFAPELSELSALNLQKEQVLDAAARSETAPAELRAAAAGDRAALEALATAAGVADEPALRGARQALDIEELPARVDGIDDGEGISALAAALRHAGDPEAHPPPVRPDPVPAPRHASLADDAPPPGRLFEIEGKPVAFREIDPARVVTDAATFQFKAGGDSQGATGRLGGVERWDPIAAGRAVLYERASGEMVIADGHQRLALARRLADQQPQLQAFVFREADGWTPGDVRALAAKKNLQEGSGSVVDAAAIMRERPDIIDKSVPLGSEAMRQARSLARLSDEAFGMVVGGVLPPNFAALVGDLVPEKSRHAGLIQELAGIDPANAREARFAVSELMQLPVHVEEQMTLLGAFRVERSLMKERVGVLDAALKALKADARVFALLDREAGRIEAAGNVLDEAANAARASEAEQVAALIEQLAATKGPVSDWLNDAARAVASGFTKRQAAAAFARRVADTLEADGLRGLTAAEPPPLRAGGFDEPGGPAAKRQTELLERQLSREIEAATKPDKSAERQAVLFDIPHQPTSRAAAEQAAIRRELLKTLTMLPDDVQLRVRDRLVFNDIGEAQGLWDGYDRIVWVSLAAADPVRTARHEVVHALRQSGLMTDAEFDTMYRFAERFGLREAYGIDGTYAGAYKKAYGDRGEDYVESLLREETVANLFSDYSLNGRRFGSMDGGGVIDTLLDMLTQFLARVRNALDGLGFRDVRDVFEQIETGAVARRAMADVEVPGGGRVFGLHLFALKAYHGSPHDFDKFDISRIGTGEGNQAFGHGLYFAEAEDIARGYRDMLSPFVRADGSKIDHRDIRYAAATRIASYGGDLNAAMLEVKRDVNRTRGVEGLATLHRHYSRLLEAMQRDDLPEVRRAGRMYEVRINADPEDFLDWDKPLSQQSEKVRKALVNSGLADDGDNYIPPAEVHDPESMAFLRGRGVAGVRYLDGNSRAAREGSRNYVVFDDSLIEIVAKDGVPVVSLANELAGVARMGDVKDVVEACK